MKCLNKCNDESRKPVVESIDLKMWMIGSEVHLMKHTQILPNHQKLFQQFNLSVNQMEFYDFDWNWSRLFNRCFGFHQ